MASYLGIMIFLSCVLCFGSHQLSDEENRKLYDKCNNPNGHGHNYKGTSIDKELFFLTGTHALKHLHLHTHKHRGVLAFLMKDVFLCSIVKQLHTVKGVMCV